MAWSYTNNPASSSKDAVRFLIQDTNTARQLVQDEEIEYLVSTEANIYRAASMLCYMLVAKAGGVSRKQIGDLSISYDPRFYQSLAMQLESRGLGHQVPYAGGISRSDKAVQQADTDAVRPAVVKGLGDNPAAPSISINADNNPLTSF